MAATTPLRPGEEVEEPPPVLGSWRNVYLLILGELAVLTLLFHVLRRWAS